MELLKYNNKRVKLTDTDKKIWLGMAYYSDADSNETDEDVLIVKTKTGYTEILESDIKSIEVL